MINIEIMLGMSWDDFDRKKIAVIKEFFKKN